MKEKILRKLTSRKFWVGIAGIVSGLIMIFGFAETSAETIAGAIITIGSAVGYMISEGIVDAKNVGQVLEGAETIVKELKTGEGENHE
jgi:phage-related holin